jgi:hypothetical protein
MNPSARRIVLVAAFVAAGCATQQQMLAASQPTAIQTATARAQFELGCQQVEAVVLTSDMMQPVLDGPLVSGPQRAEYTVGVSGCGKKAEYVVLCPEGSSGCVAARRDLPAAQ